MKSNFNGITFDNKSKMDELVDFEELIDLGANLSLVSTYKQIENISQKSSQEPLSDVLDKMCAVMGESNLTMDDTIQGETSEVAAEIVPDETLGNLDEFEHILATTYLSNNCTDVDETVNNITNAEQKEIIRVVEAYNLSIDFEDLKTIDLDVDSKDLKETLTTADIEVECKHVLDTAKLAEFNDIDISFSEDIINLDNFLSDDKATNQEIVANNDDVIITNTLKGSMQDIDNVKDIVTVNLVSDDGYNSSDFEFISEDEATKDGIFAKSKITKNINKSVKYSNAACTSASFIPSTSNSYNEPNIKLVKNEASHSEYIKYSKYRYQRCYAQLSSEHHVIPEGEQYLDMFRGQFTPVIISNLHILRNKSVLPTTAMGAKFEDLGFSVRDHADEENEEYKDEADQCLKKILSTYPSENRRKRRRF